MTSSLSSKTASDMMDLRALISRVDDKEEEEEEELARVVTGDARALSIRCDSNRCLVGREGSRGLMPN